MLTEFYERCSKYYGAAGGQGAYGCASEDEKRLTMTLFLSIFESLAQMDYDPELFGKVGAVVPFLFFAKITIFLALTLERRSRV